MATALPEPPYTAPVIDQNGFMTQPWLFWIQKAMLRMGGTSAESNKELYTVEADRIVDGAVTTPKLAAGAVTTAKIGTGEVGTTNLADSGVTAAKIAAAVAGGGLVGGAGIALAVNVDNSTLEVASDIVQLKDGGTPFAKFLGTDWTNSISTSGSQKLPSGLILKWGVTASINSATNSTITFGSAFPTACRQVIAGIQGNSAGSSAATGQWGTGGYTTAQFDLYNRTSSAYTFNWIAVGH
jgi:hypothetical protein